jgi:Tfp pilus assembly protein PilX
VVAFRQATGLMLVAGAAMLVALPGVNAAEGVLVESIPANVDKAAAIVAAEDALKYREWKIVGEDADSVSATISRMNVDAKIRISAAGSRLAYNESGTGPSKINFTGRRVPSVVATPSRWIEYLRTDTTERLMARAAAPLETRKTDTPSKPDVAPASAPAGLITADEYGRKKDEILRGL